MRPWRLLWTLAAAVASTQEPHQGEATPTRGREPRKDTPSAPLDRRLPSDLPLSVLNYRYRSNGKTISTQDQYVSHHSYNTSIENERTALNLIITETLKTDTADIIKSKKNSLLTLQDNFFQKCVIPLLIHHKNICFLRQPVLIEGRYSLESKKRRTHKLLLNSVDIQFINHATYTVLEKVYTEALQLERDHDSHKNRNTSYFNIECVSRPKSGSIESENNASLSDLFAYRKCGLLGHKYSAFTQPVFGSLRRRNIGERKTIYNECDTDVKLISHHINNRSLGDDYSKVSQRDNDPLSYDDICVLQSEYVLEGSEGYLKDDVQLSLPLNSDLIVNKYKYNINQPVKRKTPLSIYELVFFGNMAFYLTTVLKLLKINKIEQPLVEPAFEIQKNNILRIMTPTLSKDEAFLLPEEIQEQFVFDFFNFWNTPLENMLGFIFINALLLLYGVKLMKTADVKIALEMYLLVSLESPSSNTLNMLTAGSIVVLISIELFYRQIRKQNYKMTAYKGWKVNNTIESRIKSTIRFPVKSAEFRRKIKFTAKSEKKANIASKSVSRSILHIIASILSICLALRYPSGSSASLPAGIAFPVTGAIGLSVILGLPVTSADKTPVDVKISKNSVLKFDSPFALPESVLSSPVKTETASGKLLSETANKKRVSLEQHISYPDSSHIRITDISHLHMIPTATAAPLKTTISFGVQRKSVLPKDDLKSSMKIENENKNTVELPASAPKKLLDNNLPFWSAVRKLKDTKSASNKKEKAFSSVHLDKSPVTSDHEVSSKSVVNVQSNTVILKETAKDVVPLFLRTQNKGGSEGLPIAAALAVSETKVTTAPKTRPAPRIPVDTIFAADDDEPLPDMDGEEDIDNSTERGNYLGAPCEFTCNPKLHHVFCDPITGHCECDKKYPVKLGPTKGCAKPKGLGEQCFYRQACKYLDIHASCIQINHNAICQCETGYHSVSYSRPVKKVFCTEDMALLAADVHTLLGVCSGIALLAGLLCLVLHLYTRGRTDHARPGHYADASLSPPMLFSSETGIPLAVHGTRPSSRSSQRSSGTRRTSPSPRGAPSGPSSRAGSRRPSLVSLQSSSSSVRSYSMRRFEKEREQKERRQQMNMRLAQLHANMGANTDTRSAPIPSPRTPNSTDGLLPAVCEGRELSLSRSQALHSGSLSFDGIIGPCSSSGTSY